MRWLLTLPAALLLAAPGVAAEGPLTSWGKAGVSYYDYRKDAIECGHNAWYEDVSETNAAKVFKLASRRLEVNEAALTSTLEDAMQRAAISAQIVETTRPEKRFDEVRTLQYAVLERCLSDRGYARFQLTEDQRAKLKKLKFGSPARHSYLYRLGSDASVLAAQRA